jgi:hypothetical protein
MACQQISKFGSGPKMRANFFGYLILNKKYLHFSFAI